MTEDNEEFQFKFPFLMASIAKRGSGKSFLTKYLVHNWIENGEIDEIMAFTNTNELNNEYDRDHGRCDWVVGFLQSHSS